MRNEIGVHPWANEFTTYLNGEELTHCRMGDEELRCAEVLDCEKVEGKPVYHYPGTSHMVWGDIEERPRTPLGERIKAEPERAQEIWDEYDRERRQRWALEESLG